MEVGGFERERERDRFTHFLWGENFVVRWAVEVKLMTVEYFTQCVQANQMLVNLKLRPVEEQYLTFHFT